MHNFLFIFICEINSANGLKLYFYEKIAKLEIGH